MGRGEGEEKVFIQIITTFQKSISGFSSNLPMVESPVYCLLTSVY
jgi:hypothetical protein